MGTIEQQAELHNKITKELTSKLFDALRAGGTVEDLLVVIESVIFGVALTVIKTGGDEVVLDAMMERVKERLAEYRKDGKLWYINPKLMKK